MAPESHPAKPDKAASKAVASRAKSAVSNLVLGNADDALRLATELQKFVKANNLTTKIQNKDFPNVEAWQFAGSLLGLSPMLESIEDKSTEGEIKWNATVNLLSIHTGQVVGRGFATCSNKESTKKFFADYAICSMAQTRAVGKAYRLALGWLMKAAGYEATPAEEMGDVGTEATVVETPKKLAPGASAPASAPLAVSTTAAPGAAPETMAEQLEALLAQIEQELKSQHITRIERGKMRAGLHKLTLLTAPASLAKIRQTCEARIHPDALPKARLALREFASANAAALGQQEYERLHLVAGGLTVVAADLIGEMQDAEEWLKANLTQAA